MITLQHMLTLSGLLFALSVAGMVLIALAGGVLVYFYEQFSVAQLMRLAEDRNTAMTQVFRNTVWPSYGESVRRVREQLLDPELEPWFRLDPEGRRLHRLPLPRSAHVSSQLGSGHRRRHSGWHAGRQPGPPAGEERQ